MTSEEMYGRVGWPEITPEQRKNRRAYLVKRLESILKPQGFVRKGVYFHRLCDDYVLHAINFTHVAYMGFCDIHADSMLLLWNWGNVVLSYPNIPEVPRFFNISWLEAGKTLEKLCKYQYPGAEYPGQSIFRIVDDFEEGVEKSCQLLQERALPILDGISNLDEFAKFKHREAELAVPYYVERGWTPPTVRELWEEYTPIWALMRGDKDTALRIMRMYVAAYEKRYNVYPSEGIIIALERVKDAVRHVEENDQEWMNRLVNDTIDYIHKKLNKVNPKILEAYRASHGGYPFERMTFKR